MATCLGCVVAGPGSGLSEEPMSGVRSVTLDCRVVPECPPGHVASRRFWSASILGVYDVGEPAREGSHRFHGGLAGGLLGVEVGAALGGVAQLDDGHDVQCPVDPAVAGAGESMPLLLSGGGVQRGGAVPGRELVAVGEPVDVAHVDEQPSVSGSKTPVRVLTWVFAIWLRPGRDKIPAYAMVMDVLVDLACAAAGRGTCPG
jgi:hypothetical protein